MAMNTKGSRKIVVDEVAYLWRIRQKSTTRQADCDNAPATASVMIDAERGQLLHISFNFTRFDTEPCYFNRQPDIQLPHAITPKMIADCIRQAKSQGWQPHGKGVFECVYETDCTT